ncbi:MAG TPA: 23S rRNA (pseudouridine(1915)-N(3))-methyltransferase RlmH [Bacteroidales bacterium]|nr:23S rRNA (pseudouridine(1915)-N(3))-methyltransferase RlmH [Bacteroidales bacterium]
MKILLIAVGKTDNRLIIQLIDDYIKRINFYIPIELRTLPDVKKSKNLSEKEQKTLEGDSIKKCLQPSDYIVLLDDKGKQLTSKDFAKYIENKTITVSKRLVFLIGGPYGFSEDIVAISNEKLSLSKMTLTHQMVRLLFVEQIYRAMTILNNEPYHHE